MKPKEYRKYERAKKKVTALKGFYGHSKVFVVVATCILVGRYYLINKWFPDVLKEEGFVNWLNWNTYLFPAIWLVVLIIHGLVVHDKLSFFKKWEHEKMENLMEQDENDTKPWK